MNVLNKTVNIPQGSLLCYVQHKQMQKITAVHIIQAQVKH